MIVSNHESATDILAFYQLNMQFRWIAKQKVFSLPIIGTAMRAADYVGVERGNKNSHQKALEDSRAVLRSGTNMLFSRRVPDQPQALRKFKIGAFKLAIEEDLPILPAILIGSGKLMRKGTLIPNKATIDLHFLPPQKHRPNEDITDYTARIERLIKKKHSELNALRDAEIISTSELSLGESEKD